MAGKDRDGIDDKSRKAFDQAFDAMAKWRDEINAATELHGEAVFDKLAEAARSVGWPDAVIEATRTQLMQASKMQADMIDHMMAAWKEQLGSKGNPDGLMEQIAPPASPSMPQGIPMTELAMAPTQFWLQATTAWQRSWSDAMAAWMGGPGTRRRRDD